MTLATALALVALQKPITLRLGENFEARLRGVVSLELFAFTRPTLGMAFEENAIRDRTSFDRRFANLGPVKSPEPGAKGIFFVELFPGDSFTFSTEIRADRGYGLPPEQQFQARIEQLWLRFHPPSVPLLRLEVGKFPTPVGATIARMHSRQRGLLTWPLAYDFPTAFGPIQDTPAAIFARHRVPRSNAWRVPIWREVYATGAMIFGAKDPFEYAVALTNAGPSSWPWHWNPGPGRFTYPNVAARVGVRPHIATRLGLSFAQGPYEPARFNAWVPAGRTVADYPQRLWVVDAEYTKGEWELYGEMAWIRWPAPFLETLGIWTYFVEARWRFAAGWYVAGRWGQMRFNRIRSPTGEHRPWDRGVTRYDLGAGHHFTRAASLHATLSCDKEPGRPAPLLMAVEFELRF